jgi:hypothetical protein
MLRRVIKEAVKVRDRLTVTGGVFSTKRGISMSDGSSVPVEKIMIEFGICREAAEKIAMRRSQ